MLVPSVVLSMLFASSGEHLYYHKEYYVIYLYSIGRKTFKYKRYKAQNILHEKWLHGYQLQLFYNCMDSEVFFSRFKVALNRLLVHSFWVDIDLINE